LRSLTLSPRRLLVVTLGLVIGGWSLFALGRRIRPIDLETLAVSTDSIEAKSPDRMLGDLPGRPYLGPANAPVTFVEFTDYECPFCGRYFQETYPTLLAVYGDRIKFAIRNFPLMSIHPRAAKAAEAAECAADQDRFWEYHDMLFENQDALGVASLKQYATDLGLSRVRFAECLDSGEKAAVVAADVRDGRAYMLNGTPTFFVNGRRIVGAQPLAVFELYIEQALQEAD
jgi:protein-disulfide isomerase